MKSDKIIKEAKRLITPALVYHTGITVKKARGIYVTGTDNRTYMDFTSALATTNIGHSHPLVTKAACQQLKTLTHSGCIFYYPSIVELARRLKTITPPGLDMFFFSNSGAEAIEGAIKLARFTTGRQGIIAFTGAFHGRTAGALSLTSSSARYRKNYHPLLPSVYHAPYPYCYRCPLGKERATCSIDCFKYLEAMLEHVITPEEVACAVIEPILGEGGYVAAPKEYLEKLRGLASRHGILLVADEVQSGMGRTGRWFACEHFGLAPDIMVIAKAVASGLPLSVVASSRKIMSKWPPGAHGTTFGGNPVSAAAACATIDVIKKQGLLRNASKLGAAAIERLNSLKGTYPSIGDVRGKGLMIGIEFVKKDKSPNPGLLKKVLNACEKKGLILIECGRHKNIVRFIPPLITTPKEMEKALDIFEDSVFSSTTLA